MFGWNVGIFERIFVDSVLVGEKFIRFWKYWVYFLDIFEFGGNVWFEWKMYGSI